MFAAIFDPFIASLMRELKKKKATRADVLNANVLKCLQVFQLPPFVCQVASCLVFKVSGRSLTGTGLHIDSTLAVGGTDSVVMSAFAFSAPVTLSRNLVTPLS